jgi:hypothetical protein
MAGILQHEARLRDMSRAELEAESVAAIRGYRDLVKRSGPEADDAWQRMALARQEWLRREDTGWLPAEEQAVEVWEQLKRKALDLKA